MASVSHKKFSTSLFESLVGITDNFESLGRSYEFEFNVLNQLSEDLSKVGLKSIDKANFIYSYPEYYYSLVEAYKDKDKNGFFDVTFPVSKTEQENRKDNHNYIVYQPLGEASWPDILLIHNRKGYPIEVKTSMSTSIMFGSCPPVPNCIYIYSHKKKESSSKTNFSVFFLGQEIITPEERIKYFSRIIPEKAELQSSFMLSNYIRTSYSMQGTRKLFKDKEKLVKNVKTFLKIGD